MIEGLDHVVRIVSALCRLAGAPCTPPILVAQVAAHAAPPHLTFPPAHHGNNRERMLTVVLPSIRRGLREEPVGVGIMFPAGRATGDIRPCVRDEAEGWAVCVVGRNDLGVGSVGLYRPGREADWQEAHEELDWLCAKLRGIVSIVEISAQEDVVFSSDSLRP